MLSRRRPAAAPGRAALWRQRGLSLVELLVGVAIGLFIVAAAALTVGNQLADNRRLVLETQLQQDLRATADIIARQLRRAGALESGQSQDLLAGDGAVYGAVNDSMNRIEQDGVADVQFNYMLNLDDRSFLYRLEGGVIKSKIGRSAVQDLTDPAAMTVTRFVIGPPAGDPSSERTSQRIPCPKLCPDGSRGCWPTVTVRNYRVEIEAQSARDPAVRRRLASEVRVRNDRVDKRAEGPASAPAFCPA